MHELTFLETDQIYGNRELEIFRRRGTKAAITDFAILLGGAVSTSHYVIGHNSLDKRTGYYWTKTSDGDFDAHIVRLNGDGGFNSVPDRSNGARVVLTIPDVSSIPSNGVFRKANDGILEIEYGYYPRSAVSKEMQHLLEQLFESNMLNKTGNTYTTDSWEYDSDEKFLSQSHTEYKFDEKKYIRVKANLYHSPVTLSNGEKYSFDDYVWLEVQPVKWLVDEKEKIMITEELIFAGVQFNNKSNYKSNFENTDIKLFMDRYLSKELFQSSNIININDNTDIVSKKIINDLYSKGYTKEQITTIALDILNQMLRKTTTNETDVKQKLKTPNK